MPETKKKAAAPVKTKEPVKKASAPAAEKKPAKAAKTPVSTNPLLDYITSHKKDAVIFKALHLITGAGEDFVKRSAAVDEIRDMLACISNDVLLEYYTKLTANMAGVKAVTLNKGIKEAKEEVRKKEDEQYVGEGKKAFPKWVNKDRIYQYGFDWRLDENDKSNTGIYFKGYNNELEQRTNFTMKPIVHIISPNQEENRRITEMNNGHATHVFELPSKAFISLDSFENLLMDQGYYYLDGMSKGDLNKLKIYYLSHYPRGYELKNLGWQQEGFFAFSNLIYNKGLQRFDEYGIAEVDGIKYLSMGSSNILKNLRKGTDIYKNDKCLSYIESPISFAEWGRLMMGAYLDKGMMGIAWCLLAVNRDIVTARTSYCPIPYCYGATQSGKTQFVNSIVAFFFHGIKMFNLNQGTEFGFWEYLGRFTNVLIPFNEFDDRAVDERRVRAFKGIADGEGRIKGSGKSGKTETQEPTAVPVLLGQYLTTVDDGSVLNRSIPEKFVENNNRPQHQQESFDKLKTHEEKGITSLLCAILGNRDYVADNYLETYGSITRQLKSDFESEKVMPKNRVIENYVTVLSMVKLYESKVELPFTYGQFYEYCKSQILQLNHMIGESNSLGEFWKAVEHLSDSGYIEPGWDYRIETVTEVKSMIGDKNSKKVIGFEKSTRLLFIKLKSIYPVFAKEKRMATGKPPIGEETIKTYLADQPYYIGTQSNGNFRSKKQGITKGTSSMVLNYDILAANDINLERSEINEDPHEFVNLVGLIRFDAKVQDILGTQKVVFNLFQDESYIKDGYTVEKHVYTRCFYLSKDKLWALKLGARVSATGMLSVRKKVDAEFRTLEVQELEILESVPGTAMPAEPPQPKFTPTPPPQQLSIENVTGWDNQDINAEPNDNKPF